MRNTVRLARTISAWVAASRLIAAGAGSVAGGGPGSGAGIGVGMSTGVGAGIAQAASAKTSAAPRSLVEHTPRDRMRGRRSTPCTLRVLSGPVLVQRHERRADRLRQIAQRRRYDAELGLLGRPEVGGGARADDLQVALAECCGRGRGVHQAAADDDKLWIERHRQGGDVDPQRAGLKIEEVERQGITLLRQA